MSLPVFGDWPPREPRKPMSRKTRTKLMLLVSGGLLMIAGLIMTIALSNLAEEYNTCRQAGNAPDICLMGGA